MKIKKLLSIILCILIAVGCVPFAVQNVKAETTPKKITEYEVGNTFEFGWYPQSEVKDGATKTALNQKAEVATKGTASWTSYGYYSNNNVAICGGLGGYGCHIVGVGKGETVAGQTLFGEVLLNNLYLVLRVCLGRAVQQTYGLCLGEELGYHVGLLVQRSKVGGAGDVGADGAVEVFDLESNAVNDVGRIFG